MLPSEVWASLPIERVGGASSSTIVPTPCGSAMVALAALLRLTVNVSVSSSTRSSTTGTLTVCVVSPGSKVSVVSGTAA